MLYSTVALASKFSPDATYEVCFTPNQPCTNLIVSAIDAAQKEILVQAYSFTSAPIANALVRAYKRGVNVKLLLDRSQIRQHGFSSVTYFCYYHVPVLIDYQPAIAHNKVIVIDSNKVITGSFNFTRAAQHGNTENILIITDAAVARKYMANWRQRALFSKLP